MTPDAFLQVAQSIGDRLCRDSVWDGGYCYWIDDAMEYEGSDWSVVSGPVTADLYSGASGIALFLARLYTVSPNQTYHRTATGAMEYALSRYQTLDASASNGLYGGWTGIAYALSTLADALGNERFRSVALQIINDRRDDDPALQALDVVFGSAGAIPALLAIHEKHPSREIIDLTSRYGEYLLATANQHDHGWSWSTLGTASTDILGFSHGAAGIGWALLELARATNDSQFKTGAEQAFAYERHHFDPHEVNWPDVRDDVGPAERFPVAWCHGAAGIGLSRLRAYELTAREDYLQEAEAAIRTTTQWLSRPSDKKNYSLCHGIGGNADLLIYAGQVLANRDLTNVAHERAAEGMERYAGGAEPWPCGTYWGGESLGLMQGLSGIGYFYLRLSEPIRVPPATIILPNYS